MTLQRSSSRTSCGVSAMALLWAVPSLALAAGLALPTGGQVTAGGAAISQGASQLVVNQSTSRAVINWNSFNVDKGASVVFNNGVGATLNRVTGGGGPSSIAGTISATGSVFLLDPAGVIISPTGRIATGGSFVASTLTLSDSAFLQGGPMQLSAGGAGSVVNLGVIRSDTGDVLLAGADVRNAGDISAPRGEAALVSGSTVEMGDGPVGSGRYRATAGATSDRTENSGTIRAADIALRSHAGNVFALAVGTGGLVEATGVADIDGNIALISDLGAATARGDLIASRQVETSGETVDFATVKVKTPKWLIDPVDLTINVDYATSLSSALATGDVILQTTSTVASGIGSQTSGPGDIYIESPISWASGSTLTLNAWHNIHITAPITVSGPGGVVLVTGKANGNATGDYEFGLTASGFKGNISFTGEPATGQNLTINNNAYTLLYSISDMVGMALNPAAKYALAVPVDPLGQTASTSIVTGQFSGLFTGLGNTVNNLVINAPTLDNVGLFSQTNGALIRDVGMVGGSVRGGHLAVGSLIGQQFGGTTRNVYSTVSVQGQAEVGGLVGDFTGTLFNAFATGNVAALDGGFGGLKGYAGGLTGTLDGGDVVNTFATGSVRSDGVNVGGLVGWSFTTGTVTDSYATGSVSGANSVGGLVGSSSGGIVTSYATGQVRGLTSLGGLLGQSSSATITTSYYDSDTTGMPAGIQADGSTGLLTSELQAVIPVGFDPAVWNVGAGLYPFISRFYPNGVQAVTSAASDLTGAPVGGAQVRFYYGGSVLGLAPTSSGANGYVYAPVPYGQLALVQGPAGTSLGATIAPDAASAISGAAYFDTLSFSGNVLHSEPVHIDAVTALSSLTSLSSLKASIASTFDAPTVTLINSSLNSKLLHIDVATAFSVDQSINNGGAVSITANDGGIDITGSGTSVSSNATGDAVTLASYGDFSNASTAGGSAVATPNGRWLIYTQQGRLADAVSNNFGGLAGKSFYGDPYNFSFDSFASTPNSGNRFVYGSQPTLTITADHGRLTYNGATQSITTHTVSGLINGDTEADAYQQVVAASGSGRNYGSYVVFAGSGTSDLNYNLVYVAGSLAIDPALLTIEAVASNKVYDGTRQTIDAPTVTGLQGSDTASGYTQTYDTKDAGVQKVITLDVSNLSISDGNGGQNYNISLNVTSTLGNISPRAVTVVGSRTYDTTTTAANNILSISNIVGGDTVNLIGSGTLVSANAGSRALAQISGSLLGLGVNNANYTTFGGTGAVTIGQAPLTLAAVGDSRTYDTSTTSSGKPTITGLLGNDAITGVSQSFDLKNAGARILLVNAGYLIADGNSGLNYAVSTTTAAGAISQAPLTLAAVSDSRTYDTTTASTAAPTVTGLLGSDQISGVSQSFDLKNAGARTLAVNAGYLIADGANGGNYAVTTTTASGAISKASLTAGLTGAVTRTYDATSAATLATTNYTLLGVQSTDVVLLNTPASGAYNNANVGTGKLVSVGGLAISGADAGNYTVNTATSANIGVISAAPLTLAAVTDSRPYDTTLTSTAAPTVIGLQGNDNVTSLTQAFDLKNAGARTLVVNGGYLINDGNSGLNYTVTTTTAAGAISKAPLTLAAVTDSRTYDTSTASSAAPTVTGLLGSDQISGVSQSFDLKNAGARTLAVNSGYVIADGASGLNYAVTTTTASGSINQATLIAALTGTVGKTYDSTTSATLAAGNYSLSGVLGNDVVGLNNPTTGAYINQNAGLLKRVSVSGIALTGADGGNYAVNSSATAVVGRILPAPLTIAAVSDSRAYDTTTNSTLTPTVIGLKGALDSVTGLSQSFDLKTAGPRTLSVNSGFVVNDGTGGANYTVTKTLASGSILKASLTASLIGQIGKVYDGGTVATLGGSNYSLSGVLANDVVNLINPTTGVYADRNVGVGKTVTVAGLAVTGADAGNYTLNATASGAIGSIARAPLVLSAVNESRVYDATVNSSTAPTVSGLVANDTVASLSQSFDQKNVGARTLNVNSNYVVNDGNGGGNYSVTLVRAQGSISQATLTAGLTGTVVKPYDATTTATLTSGNYTLSGILAADQVSLNAPTTGNYGTPDVGTAKPVSVTGIGISGADAGNYVVNTAAAANIGEITYSNNSSTQIQFVPAPPPPAANDSVVQGEGQAAAAAAAASAAATNPEQNPAPSPAQMELKADEQKQKKAGGSPVTQSGNGDQLSGDGFGGPSSSTGI